MPLRCSDSHRTAVLCRGLPGLGYAAAGRMFAVLRHPAVQLCRCRGSAVTGLPVLRLGERHSAAAVPCAASVCRCYQCDAGALPRFAVHGHSVPVQGDELLASAIALHCNSMPSRSCTTLCRCAAKRCRTTLSHCTAEPTNAWAMLCHAPPERCAVMPRCAGASQWIPLRNFACAICADPCRSAASAVLRWPMPLPCSETPVRALPVPISAMQCAGEQCRCGAFGCLA